MLPTAVSAQVSGGRGGMARGRVELLHDGDEKPCEAQCPGIEDKHGPPEGGERDQPRPNAGRMLPDPRSCAPRGPPGGEGRAEEDTLSIRGDCREHGGHDHKDPWHDGFQVCVCLRCGEILIEGRKAKGDLLDKDEVGKRREEDLERRRLEDRGFKGHGKCGRNVPAAISACMIGRYCAGLCCAWVRPGTFFKTSTEPA